MEPEYVLAVAINTAVVCLLLEGTTRIMDSSINHWKMLIASVVNGIYCCMCLVIRGKLTDHVISRMLCICLVCLIAFGINNKTGIKSCVFFILYMSHDGIRHLFPKAGSSVSLIYAIIIIFLCGLAKRYGIARRKYAKLEISYHGRSVCLDALHDTGNNLRDPVTGESIIVIGPDASSALTGLSRDELKNPLDTITSSHIRCLRLFPYTSVGKCDGMMLGMRFENAKINGTAKRLLVGMAADGIGGFEALIGGNYDY